jgi:hypothetical protein
VLYVVACVHRSGVADSRGTWLVGWVVDTESRDWNRIETLDIGDSLGVVA